MTGDPKGRLVMESTAAYRASVAVWQYCPPVLFAFGTFGNVMTVVILRRMRIKRSAMPVYLTALAVCDTGLLYTGLLRRWVMYVFGVDFRTLHSSACKLHTWFVYSFIIVSAWILTFMTVERTLSVWRPHHVSLLCTRTKATVIVVAIVTTSLLVNSHLLYGVDVVTTGGGGNGTGDDGNGTRTSSSSSSVCYGPDEGYMYFFDAVWSWVDLTLSSLIPFTVLLLGNCLILWKVSLSDRAARYLGSVRHNDAVQRRKKTSSMTITLVVLSVIFFLTTSPICVYNIIEHYVEGSVEGDPVAAGRLRLAWAVVNILMYTNSTVNFYLYCLSGAKFRRELQRCLCCHLDSQGLNSKVPDGHSASINANNQNGHHRHHVNHQNNHSNLGEGDCSSVTNTVSLKVHNRALRSVLDENNEISTEF